MTKCGYNILARCLASFSLGDAGSEGWQLPDSLTETVSDSGLAAILARLPVFEIPEVLPSDLVERLNREFPAGSPCPPAPFPSYVVVAGCCAVAVFNEDPLVAVSKTPSGYIMYVWPPGTMFVKRMDHPKCNMEVFVYAFDHNFKTRPPGLTTAAAVKSSMAEMTAECRGQAALVCKLLADTNSWAVEVSPVKPPKVKARFVPRLHERHRIQIWLNKKVHETFRAERTPAAVGEKGIVFTNEEVDYTIAAHRRRGCWHTLRSPRFTHKQGKRVWVQATWVGPREMVKGQNLYEVRLDI